MPDAIDLSGLLPLLRRVPAYDRLLADIGTDAAAGGPTVYARFPLLDAAKPFVLAGLYRDLGRPLLILTADAPRARQLAEQVGIFLGDADTPAAPGRGRPSLPHGAARVAFFPETDALFYEQLGWDPALTQERLSALRLLQHGGVLVASVRAAMQRLWPPSSFGAAEREIAVGQRLDLDRALAAWMSLGYEPAAAVTQPGEFARRGGIVDVSPPASQLPVRLELFGDEVETIRLFDPATQRSVERIERVTVTPPRELPASQARAVADALRRLDFGRTRPEVTAVWAHDLERLGRGESFAGAEYYGSFAAPGTLADFLPETGVLVQDEPGALAGVARELAEQAEALRDELEQRGEIPVGLPRPSWTWDELASVLTARLAFDWEAAQPTHELGAAFEAAPVYGGKLKDALGEGERALRSQRRVVIVSQQALRLAELLRERGLGANAHEALPTEPTAGSLTLVRGQLAEGWRVPALDLVVLSDAELFGWSKPRPRARRRPVGTAMVLHELTPGDFVVHQDHGIGRFAGLKRQEFDGGEREYLVIQYANDDRLFVPADQADRVGRYVGPSGEAPTLHRLGGADWLRAKTRARRAARDIAKELLEIYAAREVKAGHAYSPDTTWQQELESSFPYVETPDQVRALDEVKADMEQPRPMDRLLCGDVGYGKTEVALRAAFKAVNDGKQVAVLVPTTVLAQQHFNTFSERLAAFPIKIEMLSRFRSEREQRDILAALAAGTVDVVIGTHRLLSRDVKFKDLGLVIIDEEQRFGVEHKERLKRLRTEVDVLTLTATPIPRTLYLTLAGIRDVSNIETPPEDRLPIKTYVAEYDEGLIREVIVRELDRGGQVYFVHNRVQGIEQLTSRLRRLVPEATFLVGHGQMPEEQLERVMIEFAAGRGDVLVCTTIIESGLDIPNVNTIIINEADKFGMAQLYQLRGRVGRGANRAYAYMLYGRDQRLSPIAEKRLRTIFEATELGAGYRIALRDLELRGAGNLLGAEQSGHVAAVGFDMYCRLLADAVQELRGQMGAGAATSMPVSGLQAPAPTIDLPLTAHLPASYVAAEADRLDLYRRLATATTVDAVGAIGLELRDRFGPPPPETLNLLYLVQLKALGLKGGVESIVARDDASRGLGAGPEIVVSLRHPVAPGAATQLTRRLGHAIHVGHTQLRLTQHGGKGAGYPPRAGVAHGARPARDAGDSRAWLGQLQALLEVLAERDAPSARAG